MSSVITERYILETRGWEEYFALLFSPEKHTARCVICDKPFEVTPPFQIQMIAGSLCGYSNVCRSCARSCAPTLSDLLDKAENVCPPPPGNF
jgi:hypothetical protein